MVGGVHGEYLRYFGVLVAELAPVQWPAPGYTGYSALSVAVWVHSLELGLFDHTVGKRSPEVLVLV